MSAPAHVQAAAALELRRRLAAGSNQCGALVQAHGGHGWTWRGSLIDDDEAEAIRRTWRGTLIIVTRSPAAHVGGLE
jgi:hypothetical protein